MQIFLDSSWLITFTNSLCVKKTDSYPIHSITQFDQSSHVRVKKKTKKQKTRDKKKTKTKKNRETKQCVFKNQGLYICLVSWPDVTLNLCGFCFGHLVVKHQIGLSEQSGRLMVPEYSENNLACREKRERKKTVCESPVRR